MEYQPAVWAIAPFALLLAMIAMGPLFFEHWWAKHYPKAAISLAVVVLAYYFFALPESARHTVGHTALEYFSFIALIGSLYIVSGGIHINVKGEATPSVNVVFLLIGAVIANLLGTTGASMLLIRPWLRMNKYRVTAHHVAFFILIVSNVGGSLTPIGDPPLFLGYLKGVPFGWVLANCWPMWLVGVGFLLGAFYVVDRRNYLKAPPRVREDLAEPRDQWRFDGYGNVGFLALILIAVFIQSPPFLREGLMIAAALGSWFTTRKEIHHSNHFDFHPLQEVAVLFIGIFATMMPALDLLKANAAQMPSSTTFFFFGTGLLSSILDNAPTYLGFLSAAAGPAMDDPAMLRARLADPHFAQVLLAISIAAVFFGACTYIGNGPNFMVKAIADRQKVHTPGFIGFIVRYTLPCMVPMLLIVWWLFFRN